VKKLINQLSVFFPAYNEEKNIEKTVLDARKVLQKVSGKWEIIIVDDGSKDKTSEISDRLTKKYINIRVVHHKPNRGYGGALKSGFKTAKYRWVAFSDSDGQFKFSQIKKFIEKQKKTNADLVLGIRAKRADSFMRKVFTWGWSIVLPRLLFGLQVTDYSCGFKMIKKEVYKKVQPLVGEEKVTQIEMLVKAQKLGFKFAEVKVNHYPRKHGEQTGADIKVITRSIRDLVKLWIRLRK
jgi:glycosyltransferase involved in cell wall biosynthesis